MSSVFSGCLFRFWNLVDDLASGEEGFFLGCDRETRRRGTIGVMLPRSGGVLMIQKLDFTWKVRFGVAYGGTQSFH